MGERSQFAGGDQNYIRTVAYGTTEKLNARARLHVEFSTAPTSWFEWMVEQIEWRSGPVVEVGCGNGALWEEGRPPIDGPVHLTDLSTGMVDTATGVARRAGFDVTSQVAAAEALPLASASATHVICNHMLYHVPRPPEAVAELARIAADDGVVSVSTNGFGHFAELKAIEVEVFATDPQDFTVRAFGLQNGQDFLAASFETIELRRFRDSLRVTDPQAVMDYFQSYPPGESASTSQLAEVRRRIDAAFDEGEGVFTIGKDSGLFLCREPRRV